MNENYNISSSPHIRSKVTTGSIMLYVIIALLPATIFGVYTFGVPALFVVLITTASAVLTEYIYQKLMKKLVPWYFGPMREKMMRLLLTILTDG